MEDEQIKDLFKRTLNLIGFVYKQNPKHVLYVVNEVKSFDRLVALCLAAADLNLTVDTAWDLYKEEDEAIKEAMGEVVQLWKEEKNTEEEEPAPTVPTSTTPSFKKRVSITKPGT